MASKSFCARAGCSPASQAEIAAFAVTCVARRLRSIFVDSSSARRQATPRVQLVTAEFAACTSSSTPPETPCSKRPRESCQPLIAAP